MCFVDNGFSAQLAAELSKKISLKNEIGNFFFVVAPRKDVQNKIEVICSLSLTASILQRDFNLLKGDKNFSEKPFNTSPISVDFAADYLIILAKEFAKVLGLKEIKDVSEFGTKRIYFLVLKAIAGFFISILNGVLSPQINFQEFSSLLTLILSESANTLMV